MIRILMLFFIINSISAQEFQGIVIYQTDRKMDMKMDSTKVSSEMQKQITEMMRKQFQKEYTLRFSKSESLYKEEESLGAPQPAGMQMVMIGRDGSEVFYKNIKEERFSSQRDMMGKTFLVKDTLEKIDWKLENETKKIGNYTCYKATAKRKISIPDGFDVDEETQKQAEENEITITAWYTPMIPISNGPSSYWGLPGLILEANDGSESILCSKIVLNPKKKMAISEPTKGKKITAEKFETLVTKKSKEMQEMHRRNRDDENVIEYRIGG